MEAEDIQAVSRQVMVNKRILLCETESKEAAKEEARKRWQRLISVFLKKVTADVNIGMLLSNMVMFFIILATGTALFANGGQKIETVEQAAKALEPVAGSASYWLFSIGVIGTGFLAIPVLCGSLSYIFSETFGWQGSLDKQFHQAKPFYGVIIVSLIIGLLINYIGISPIQALLYTAILYGVTSPIIIAVILHIGNNKKIMGDHTNGTVSNILGALTFFLMTASAIFLIYLQFES